MKRLSAALVAVILTSLLTAVTATAASASCDYSAADQNNGWGWDAATGTSCAPLQQAPVPTDGCDYSAAAQNNGWGWNPTTGTSCAPTQTQQQPAVESDTEDLVQPRILSGVRHLTFASLSWDASGADSFVVVRNGTQIAEVAGSEFNDVGLNAGVTYKYAVFGRRGVTVMPNPGRPQPIFPPSWPTVELPPGTSGDAAGAPTTSAGEIYDRLQAIDDALIDWVIGIINPAPGLPGQRNAPPVVIQLLTVLLGANPTATQEADATAAINSFLAASGSTMRVPNPAPRPGSTPSVQYGLAEGLRSDIKDDIDNFRDFHGTDPDDVQTMAIVRSAINAAVRQGLSVSDTGYDPGSPESIAEEYVGAGNDGTLGEFGGTDSVENAAADAAAAAASQSTAQQAADTYSNGDLGGEFGSSSSGGGADDREGSDNDSGGHSSGGSSDSSGGQSTAESAAETYSGGDPAGEFG